jgi:hypothetical protein
MSRSAPIQVSFLAGEISPLAKARVDIDRYKQALERCYNSVPTLQGAILNRPGTVMVGEVRDSSKKTYLYPFKFSTTQAYQLEFSENAIRVFANRAVIIDPDTTDPLVITTTYAEDELAELYFTQSADVLYIAHKNHPLKKLQRFSDAGWILQDVELLDGPYLPPNTTPATVTPSAATGSGVTLTAGPDRTIIGGVTDINGEVTFESTAHGFKSGDRIIIGSVHASVDGIWLAKYVDDDRFSIATVSGTRPGGSLLPTYGGGGATYALFRSTDVGRQIRIKQGTVWGWAKITAFSSEREVTIDIKETLTSTAAKDVWRLGLYSETTGYPSVVTFHESRLFLLGPRDNPQRVDGSQTEDYENFAPTGLDGVVVASNAVDRTLSSNEVNAIQWAVSDEKGLVIGTTASEWVVKSSSTTEAISPTTVIAKEFSAEGSAKVKPVKAGSSIIFVSPTGKKMTEVNYFYDSDKFKPTDVSLLSDHLTRSGIVQITFQKEPFPIVWGATVDGKLVGMTFSRDADSLKLGWHWHEIGGVSNAAGDPAVVESVSVLPTPDGTSYELWLVVKRLIDGQTVRYVEYLSAFFTDEKLQDEAFFVDSGLTLNAPKTISAVTKASTAVVTSTSHGFSNGDTVRIVKARGMTELNGRYFTVANETTHTFELLGVDSTTYGTYLAGSAEVRKCVSTIAGLGHLEGESVAIFADGATQNRKTVATGESSLDTVSSHVHAGLPYKSRGQLLRLDSGAADGTSIGKLRRVHKVGFLLHRSLNMKLGMNFDSMDRLQFQGDSEGMGDNPALFSGIISEQIESGYDFENQVAWEQDLPQPLTILAIFPRMVTQDGG